MSQVNFNTSKTGTTIYHSDDCIILANNSQVIIRDGSKVKVNSDDSSITLTGGASANINGDHNVIYGEKIGVMLLYGNNSTIAVQNVKEFVWSGSEGQCQLVNSKNLNVYGKQNVIIGKLNSNVMVCGHDNFLVASKSKNLKIRGHKNQVETTRIESVTVDGDENIVSVSNTHIRHTLRKTLPVFPNSSTPMSIPENQIDFCGIPVDCTVFSAILCPPPTRVYEMGIYRDIKPEHHVSGVDCVGDDFFQEGSTNTNFQIIMPQLQIHYVHQACIKRSMYNLGIFNVYIQDLSELHHNFLPIKVKVMVEELDQGTYEYTFAPSRKSVAIFGSKNKVKQILRITGNRITENDETDYTFNVYFEAIEEGINEGFDVVPPNVFSSVN